MSRRRSIDPRMFYNETWAVLSPRARLLLLALGTFCDYADRFRVDLVKIDAFAPGLWDDEAFAELIAMSAVVVDGDYATVMFTFGAARRRVSKWHLLRAQVFERDGHKCQYCGSTEGPMHCDHVVPQSRGGADTLANLVTACAFCNMSKGDRTPEEWRAARQ